MKNKILVGLSTGIIFMVGLCIFLQTPKVSEKNKYSKEEISQGRAQWQVDRRGGKIEPEKMVAARTEVRNLIDRAQRKREGGLNEWEFVGPHDVGGRVRAFAINPLNGNILYTGGASGGIFKSTDAAASWTALDDFLPSLSVTSIVVNPNNPAVLYASTGEGITGGGAFNASSPGAGIFKSEDAGDTWNLINALDPENLDGYYWINSLAMDPVNPAVLYAAGFTTNEDFTSFAGAVLYKVKMGGDSIETLPIVSSNGQATKVYVNPNDRDNIFLCLSSGLQVTWDRGQTWSAHTSLPGFITASGRVEVAMSESNDSVVYALLSGSGLGGGAIVGSILRSTNKGMDWDTSSTNLTIFDNSIGNAGGYHNVIWVDPQDVDNLIVGGVDLHRSTNAGVTLTQISDWTQHDAGTSAHADHHVIVAARQFDTNTNPRVYFGNDGGIARTLDYKTVTQTTGWQILNDGLNITQFYASDIDLNNPNEIIAGSQDNGTWRTEDSGNTWTKPRGGDGGYCALSKQGTDPKYLSTQFGNFEATFPPLIPFFNYFDLGTVDNPPFIAVMEIYPNDGNRILVGGDNLWQITNNGLGGDVKQVSPRLASFGIYITAIDITADSNQIVVGYLNGDVYKSSNGSDGPWTQLLGSGTSTGFVGNITDIATHPTDDNKIMVTVGGYKDDNIWYTDDGGTTWEERSSGIPALHINTIAWHPAVSTWVYVGTDMGVMGSENTGQDWNVKPSNGKNDGPVMTEITKLQFTRASTFGEHTLVATTYGRGIWKTKFVVRKHVYLDEDCGGPCGIGIESIPFTTIEEAEERQAHGQRWTFDGGNYPVTGKVIIDHNIGKIITENEEVIRIGN